MKKLYNDILEKLEKNKEVSNLEEYDLVNNYGVTFIFKGVKYDLRHQVNVYGMRVNDLILSGHNKTVYLKSEEEFILIFEI